MAIKVFMSDWTWRTDKQQEDVLASGVALWPQVPIFFGESDRDQLVRRTSRTENDSIIAASVACFAKNEDDFKQFLLAARKRKLSLKSVEESFVFTPSGSISNAVREFQAARKKGSSKVGARISGDKRRAASLAACEKIKHLWPLPSRGNSIKKLESLSGIARGTIVSILGNRGIAQYNYQAKLKRRERHEQRAN